MTAAFPEALFAPAAGLAAGYAARVAAGRAEAARSSAAVCALARNLGARAAAALEAIAAIGGLFAAARLCVYENDSDDGTPAALEAWAAADPAGRRVRSERLGRPRWPSIRSGPRCEDMADYRNRCRALALEGGTPDYVVALDADLAAVSLAGIASSLGTPGWDGIAACGLRRHSSGRWIQYDAWAWRDLGHPHPHPAREINPRVFDRGAAPVPVLSAFGGLAIYRGAAYAAAEYGGEGDIEHATFHRRLAAAGFPRILVNPGMVALY